MNIIVIDRSDLNEVVAFIPKENRTVTRREDLMEKGYSRTDIVLLSGTHTGKQYSLHVTANGFFGDLFILDVLDKNQYKEVIGIAERMRQNAIDYTPAGKLLC